MLAVIIDDEIIIQYQISAIIRINIECVCTIRRYLDVAAVARGKILAGIVVRNDELFKNARSFYR